LDRTEALSLVKKHLKTRNLVKHTLATEAVMREMAARLDQDVERWGLAGLLHDIDYDETKGDPARHSLEGADLLADQGLDGEIVDAVRAHNDHHGLPRDSMMAKALYCADSATGLIVAAALVHPDRKLASLDTEFIMNRYGEKSFARGARRESIAACGELGLDLEEFLGIALRGMRSVSKELGL